MAGTALRDFALWVTTLTDGTPPNPKLTWIIQKAQNALAEDARSQQGVVRFRNGIPASFPGERPRFLYATGASPAVTDVYVLDAGDRPTADLLVAALNAYTPPA